MKTNDIKYLGDYTLSDTWDKVSLEQFSNYVRYISQLKENEEGDPIEILQIFSNIPKEVILEMSVEMFEHIMEKLTFLNEKLDLNEQEANPSIEIKGETYQINYMESLNTREYLDLTTLLDSDNYNYPYILAILCRKPNETYTEEYSLKVLPQRLEMFKKLNVKEALKLISFFFVLHNKYTIRFLNYLRIKELKEIAQTYVESIENSLNLMAFITPSKWKAISQLRKCKKRLTSI